MIAATVYREDIDIKSAPLWWHERGLSYTRSGYGGRIPTMYMGRLPGTTRWRRIYCAVWSNAGTCYIEDRKQRGANGRPAWIVVA